MRPALLSLALLLPFATAILAAQPAAAPAPKPNILLILSDDHSAPHLGAYGHPDVKTPHLDRLAAQGLRFDRAYVTTPQCVPSRASIMTGRSPVAIGMTRFSAPLPRDIKTFPEALRAAGWFTGVAGRTFHLEGAPTTPESRATFEKYKLTTFRDRLDYVNQGGENAVGLAQFREFLDLKPSVKPFFLQLGSSDPHRPLTNRGPVKHDPAKLTLPAHYPDTPLVRADLAAYYDEIAHLDVWIGEVLAELEKRGLAQNTLVAFMADNGASQFRGKGTLNEFGIHVPLLMRWPGVIQPGSASAALISGEDLAPTFLAAAGLPIPPEMTGQSFAPLLRGAPFTPRTHLFAQRGPHASSLPGTSSSFDLGRVVVTPTHKLIYNAMGQLPYWPVDFAGQPFWQELVGQNEAGKLDSKFAALYFAPTRPMFELYDLKADPAELTNLAGRPETAALERTLKGHLQEWMILERDFIPLPIAPEPAGGGAGKKGAKKKATDK